MTIALLAALTAVILAFAWLLDRTLKRHSQNVERLLLWRHDPDRAATPAASADVPLYVPPEDDEAWNQLHGRADS